MKRLSLAFIISLFCLNRPAHAANLELDEYRSKLKELLQAVEKNDLTEINRLAKKFDGKKITVGSEEFHPDSSILTPLKNAKNADDTRLIKPRLKVLLAAIASEKKVSDSTGTVPNKDVFNKLRDDERIRPLPRDGEVPDGGISEWHLWRWFKQLGQDLGMWIIECINSFFKWLSSLMPKTKMPANPFTGDSFKILVIVFAVLLLGLVVYVIRKRQPGSALELMPSSLPPPTSVKDADPTSRGADEWENYAGKLAASGRYREAIRAWYHALLVTHFRAGHLHYRKGRTNWEYCYALPHTLSWRQRFMDLTGFFEVEWYGRLESAPEDFSTYAGAVKELLNEARKLPSDNKESQA